MRRHRKETPSLLDHLGGELAAVALVGLIGLAAATWRASRAAQYGIDARTRARLTPRTSEEGE